MERIPSDRLYFSDFVLKAPQEISSGTYFEDGDLLLSKITPCFENGKQGIATKIPKGFGIATTEVIPIKAIEGVSYLPFLAMYLLDRGVRNSLAGKMEGATGRQRLAKSVLKGWIMPFPPLPEQQAIADVLSKIQSAVEVQDKIVTTLKELKAATMAKLFREGLRSEPLKQTDIGEIPESWEVVQLGDVATIRYGLGQPPELTADGVPMIRATDIKRGRVMGNDILRVRREAIPVSRNPFLKAGDIIVVRSGAYTGDAAVITKEWEGAIAGYDLIVTPSEKLDPYFAVNFLLGTIAQSYFRGQRDRSAQPHINSQQLSDTPVALPPLTEQRSIAHAFKVVNENIIVSEKKRDTLKFLFSSMLHLLITGQMRVTALREHGILSSNK